MTWTATPLIYLKRAHQEDPVDYIDSVIAAFHQRSLTHVEAKALVAEVTRLRRIEKSRATLGPYAPTDIDTLLATRNCLERFEEILDGIHAVTSSLNLHRDPPRSLLHQQVRDTTSQLSAMMEAIAQRNSHTTTHDNEGHTP